MRIFPDNVGGAAKTIVHRQWRSYPARWRPGMQASNLMRNALVAQKKRIESRNKEKLGEAVQFMAEAKALTNRRLEKPDGYKRPPVLPRGSRLPKNCALARSELRGLEVRLHSSIQIWDQHRDPVFGVLNWPRLSRYQLGVLWRHELDSTAGIDPLPFKNFQTRQSLAFGCPFGVHRHHVVLRRLCRSETFFQQSVPDFSERRFACGLAGPTLVNTDTARCGHVGHRISLNVADVLQRFWVAAFVQDHFWPASLPLMFAGMRISLGAVGWVLIRRPTARFRTPGLGKFVGTEFQNGSELNVTTKIVSVWL